MYNILSGSLGYEPRRFNFPKLDFILKKQLHNLNKVVKYYRTQPITVESNHIFVRLLQSLPTGREMGIYEYRDLISDYTHEIGNALNFTTEINHGKVFSPGILLGEDTQEVIILNTESFSPLLLKTNWKETSALRWISHPKTDLNYHYPNGEGYSNEKGLAILTLNLPLLACQYRYWKERQTELEVEYRQTPMQFVANYILANAIKSFSEVTFFNIFHSLFNGEKVSKVPTRHPFFINNDIDKITKGIGILTQRYLDRNMKFKEVMSVIPGLENKNLLAASRNPSILATQQVVWALNTTQFKLYNLLLLWDTRTLSAQNRKEKNEIKRGIRRMRSDNVISRVGSPKVREFIINYIKDEIEPFL